MKKLAYNQVNLIMFVISWIVFLSIGSHSLLYNDEMTSLLEVRMPLGKMLRFLFMEDAHLPVYFVLLKIWQFFFGETIFVARCFSYAGLLACAFGAGHMVKNLYGEKAGLWYTALFLFLSGYMFLFAITIRMFSWACFFCTASFLETEKALRKGEKKDFILYTVYAFLGAWTHYYASLACALIALSFLWRAWKKDREVLKKCFISNTLLFLSVCPQIYLLFHRPEMIQGAGWINEKFASGAWRWFFCDYNQESFFEKTETFTMYFLWIMGIKFLLNGKKSEEKNAAETGLFVALSVLGTGLIISSLYHPILVGRYLSVSFGCLCVFFVFGILDDRKNEIILGVLMLLSFFPPVFVIREKVNNSIQPDFYQTVKENVTADDIIITANFRLTYWLYYHFPDYDVRELKGYHNDLFKEKEHQIDEKEIAGLLKEKNIFVTMPVSEKVNTTDGFDVFDLYMETPFILKKVKSIKPDFN